MAVPAERRRAVWRFLTQVPRAIPDLPSQLWGRLRCCLVQANRAALAELKAFQERVRLEDEVAAEAIKEASRAYVEDVLGKGIASTKKRTRVRDYSDAVRVRPLHQLATCARHELRQGFCGCACMGCQEACEAHTMMAVWLFAAGSEGGGDLQPVAGVPGE